MITRSTRGGRRDSTLAQSTSAVAALARRAPPGLAAALGVVAVIVYFSFRAGGFFPGTVALVAVALGLTLALRAIFGPRPLAGLSLPYALGGGALGLLAFWTLLSGAWSGAPARSIVEYDRVLLYLLGFVVFGAAGRSPDRLRWMVRAIAAAAFGVCLCALITRLLPDVWQIAPALVDDELRLSYPLTYWNALGLLAGIGVITCFALTSDEREARAGRVLAAAALPVLATTLLLTLSRGSLAATAAGLLALVVAARPRALRSGLLVAGPTVAVAVAAAYRADLLAATDATPAAATTPDHGVAIVVLLCVGLAAAARAALLRIDLRVGAPRPSPFALRRALAGLAVVGVVCLGMAFALGVPAGIERRYDAFVSGEPVNSADPRERLTRSGDNGRIVLWNMALDGFRESRLLGQGAGTFALTYDRQGAGGNSRVQDAHSVYAEVLGELGIVGLLLLLAALLLILGGFLARARGPDRVLGGALFGCGLAWAMSAGVDWMWEMPAVTFWLFAAGGLALAREARAEGGLTLGLPDAARRVARLVAAVGCLALVFVPARWYLSERPLRESERAFARGDCPRAVDRALDSTAVLGGRPQAYHLIGYCDISLGEPKLAVRALAAAVRNDPDKWATHYGLALTRAAAGLDPRPEARIARRLRPGEARSAALLRLFDTDDPSEWRRRALKAPLPL